MKNTIIIFDDDAEILQICAIILESKGFRVVTANNCDDVAQKIIEAGAHVILMDNSIPQSGGIAATRIIKETEGTKHIPVIFLAPISMWKSSVSRRGLNTTLQSHSILRNWKPLFWMR